MLSKELTIVFWKAQRRTAGVLVYPCKYTRQHDFSPTTLHPFLKSFHLRQRHACFDPHIGLVVADTPFSCELACTTP